MGPRPDQVREHPFGLPGKLFRFLTRGSCMVVCRAHEWLEVPRREDEEDDAKAAAAEEDAAKDPEASA